MRCSGEKRDGEKWRGPTGGRDSEKVGPVSGRGRCGPCKPRRGVGGEGA